MKINGRVHSAPNVVTEAIPRGTNPKDAIIFKARAVTNWDEFEKLVPEPTSGLVAIKPDGTKTAVPEQDKAYQLKLNERNKLETDFMVIESLRATDGLEWETVKADAPSTWPNWRRDLANAGLTKIEIGRVFRAVLQANCLDDKLVEDARETFLRGQVAASQP